MIVYNVTTLVDHSIAKDWLSWIKEEHIPDIIATGTFTHATVLHLLDVDETEGITYVVQYHAAVKAEYDRYVSEFASSMRKKAIDKWGDKMIAFRSIMELVH